MERSIFLFGTYDPANPCFGTILKLDLNEVGPANPPFPEHVALFSPGPELDTLNDWVIWRACSLSTNVLCLLPIWIYDTTDVYDASEIKENVELNAYIYDMKANKMVKKFKAPTCTKFYGRVFSLEGNIYFIAEPSYTNLLMDPSFQKYDPVKEIWESLPPVPWTYHKDILGYAVFDEFVLFSIMREGIWGYDVSTNKWYRVTNDYESYSFNGLGTILENKTLYAINHSKPSVTILLVLSITREEKTTTKVVFTCSLLSEFVLPYCTADVGVRRWEDDVLVHLDDKEFCLIRIGLWCNGEAQQILQLVRFRVAEKDVVIVDILQSMMEIFYNVPFHPLYCFSLPAPDSKDIVEIEHEDNINLDPRVEFENEDVTHPEGQTISKGSNPVLSSTPGLKAILEEPMSPNSSLSRMFNSMRFLDIKGIAKEINV